MRKGERERGREGGGEGERKKRDGVIKGGEDKFHIG